MFPTVDNARLCAARGADETVNEASPMASGISQSCIAVSVLDRSQSFMKLSVAAGHFHKQDVCGDVDNKLI